MAPLPPRDQRHLWLRYQVEGYTKEIIYDFKQRLETIFGRQVKRVHILDFEGLTPDMRQELEERMRMVYTRDDGQEVFVSHTWWRLFGIRVPLVQEFILEFFSTCRIRDEIGLDVAGTLCFRIGGARDFLRGAPSYTYIRDSVQRLCHGLISYSISGRGQAPKKYLFRHAEGRKSSARLSGCHFIGRLAHHFGLVSDDGLRGLSVVARELPLIGMGELVKLNICMNLGDDWAWVAPRPKRQQVATASASAVAEDAPTVDEGDQDVLEPGLRRDVESLRGLVERSMTDQGRFSTWMISCMAQLMDAIRLTYQAFNGTFSGISPAAFQRRTRQRTSEASTSTAQQDQ
ncbi:hypothetical protein Tco_1432661 [Tanacetum coccineum]